jgi:hypothetical protein
MHKYTIPYIKFTYDYYTLGSYITYTKGSLKPKHASHDVSEFAEVISLNAQYISFTLEENAIHRSSKPRDPSMAPNPHRFGHPTGIPHRHHRKRKKLLTYTQEMTRAKLERLCSSRLILRDQTIMTRHTMALSKAKGLISLLAPIRYY